jgi:hypothetical protein
MDSLRSAPTATDSLFLTTASRSFSAWMKNCFDPFRSSNRISFALAALPPLVLRLFTPLCV